MTIENQHLCFFACQREICTLSTQTEHSGCIEKIQNFLRPVQTETQALPKKMGRFTNLHVILAQGRRSSCIAPVVVRALQRQVEAVGFFGPVGCRFGLPCISFLRGSREGQIRGDFQRKQTLPSCPLPVAENRQAKQMSRDGGGVLRAVAALDRKQTFRRALGVGGWGGEREGDAVLCPDSECRQPFLPSFSPLRCPLCLSSSFLTTMSM
ncbi:uncharacterized protein LOC111096211 isoform X1 [Canis lupus familiaris]|uniref:uncharacterized protein LOC111096211 isoform X1 n=1 Tax=Canis lupus familiaris TaxID=9615 RepID=UPI0002256904|nr:uncharacterized protein LOC111096211 isoform X1 [Canis lupus familiaris]|eukprot:XP_022275423.1 uncharacterized protein LOC111096211 isoform X2 [Canis lupus familiaris]